MDDSRTLTVTVQVVNVIMSDIPVPARLPALFPPYTDINEISTETTTVQIIRFYPCWT